MTLRFKTMVEMQKQFSDPEILLMVTRYLDQTEKRSEYHKEYNQKKTEALRVIRTTQPELYRKIMGK